MIDKVIFRKPNLGQLHDMGFLAVDMHVHTNYSDSTTKISNLIKAAKKKQVGDSITDHNTITGVLKAMEESDIFIVPGIEINCKEGRDIQAYFYNKNELIEFYDKCIRDFKFENPYGRIKKSVLEVLSDLENYNCISSASQPYGVLWKGWVKFIERSSDGKEILDKVNAIEIMNGEDTHVRNLKALHFATEHEKMITAGSDAHTLGELGKIVSYSNSSSVDEFLDAIRKKNNYVMGKEGTRLRGLFNQSRVFHKRIKYMPSIVEGIIKFSLKTGLVR